MTWKVPPRTLKLSKKVFVRLSQSVRTMTSTSKATGGGDHMDRTSTHTREKILSPAVVTRMTDLSPTIKGLTLQIQDPRFTFKAGQWVDFFIPGMEKYTGYSMCCSPSHLELSRTLDLAIKFSDYSPTKWVHTECKVGSEVSMRVGGDFCYDPRPTDPTHDLLLIAGGIGINPMISMMRHVADLRSGQHGYKPGNVMLLYSAATYQELVFKDDIDKMCRDQPDTACRYFVTKQALGPDDLQHFTHGRISREALQKAVSTVSSSSRRLLCYICGPGPMIDDMEAQLLALNVPQSQIQYERWW